MLLAPWVFSLWTNFMRKGRHRHCDGWRISFGLDIQWRRNGGSIDAQQGWTARATLSSGTNGSWSFMARYLLTGVVSWRGAHSVSANQKLVPRRILLHSRLPTRLSLWSSPVIEWLFEIKGRWGSGKPTTQFGERNGISTACLLLSRDDRYNNNCPHKHETS